MNIFDIFNKKAPIKGKHLKESRMNQIDQAIQERLVAGMPPEEIAQELNIPLDWVEEYKFTKVSDSPVDMFGNQLDRQHSSMNEDDVDEAVGQKFIVTLQNVTTKKTSTVLVSAQDEDDAKDMVRHHAGLGQAIINAQPARGNEQTTYVFQGGRLMPTQGVAEAGNKPGWALDPKTKLELKKRRDQQKTIAKWAGKDVPKQDVKEFAPGKDRFEPDNTSEIVKTIKRLLDSGNKVDSMLAGSRGHIYAVAPDLAGFSMKKYNKPRAGGGLFRFFGNDEDDQVMLKMIKPGHYQLWNKELVDEGWFDAKPGSWRNPKPGIDDAGRALMKQDRQAHPDMDDYSWQLGWIYADGDKDVKAAYKDAYYDNPTVPSPPEPRSFKLGFNARSKQGVAEEASRDYLKPQWPDQRALPKAVAKLLLQYAKQNKKSIKQLIKLPPVNLVDVLDEVDPEFFEDKLEHLSDNDFNWVFEKATQKIAKSLQQGVVEGSQQYHVVSKLDGNVLASYKTREEAHKNSHGNPVVSGSLETIGDRQYVREQGVVEGWSGNEPTWVCVNGKRWKKFPTHDHARNVGNKLQEKFRREGKKDVVSYDHDLEDLGEDISDIVESRLYAMKKAGYDIL